MEPQKHGDASAADNFDVIVVGGGPGGATAAWKCAEGGLRVLILERAATLPRYKPCGGGLPASITRYVSDLDPAAFADLCVTHLRHSWKGKDPVLAPLLTRDGAPAEVFMVQRPHFDRHLLARAEAAGAHLETGVRVSGARFETGTKNCVRVSGMDATGEARTWRARTVIGADGAKGVVGASVGLRLQKRHGIAREIEIPFASGENDDNRWHPALAPGAAYLDYGTVPNGYAWIFPKRNCLSVGAGLLLPQKPAEGTNKGNGDLLRRAMDSLLASVGLPPVPEGENAPRLWAHPIPYWTGVEPLHASSSDTGANAARVLLVGDAAGVVQPLFGEGIQYALRTGDLAARLILRGGGAAAEYTDHVKAEFAREFDAAARVARVFHRSPFLSYRLGVKNPRGTHFVGRILAGEASFADLEDRLYERLRNPLSSRARA